MKVVLCKSKIFFLFLFFFFFLLIVLCFNVNASDWLGIDGSYLDSNCGSINNRFCAEALNGTDYWEHSVMHKHWFVLDLGKTYMIEKVRGRSKSSYDPIDVNIYCDNSNPPTTLCKEGITTWQDTSNWVEIELTTNGIGRYVKVEVDGTEFASPGVIQWGGNPAPTFTIFDIYANVTTLDVWYHPSKSNAYYNISDLVFDSLTISDYVFTFNSTDFNTTAPNRINITLSLVDDSPASAGMGVTVIEFNASMVSGNAWFNISSLQEIARYLVNKDSVLMVTTVTNNTGFILFNNSAWGGSGNVFSILRQAIYDVFGEYPTNNSNLFALQPLLYFNLSTDDGTTMNYTLFIGDTSNPNTAIAYNKNVGNGTYALANHSFYNATTYSKDYYWRVYVEGGGEHLNETFNFKPIRLASAGMGYTPSMGLPLAIALSALLIGIFAIVVGMQRRRNR